MALPRVRQLLPQGVLRVSKPEEVNGIFKIAVYTQDTVQWPDGPSLDELKSQLKLRAAGVEFIDELTLSFQGKHIWLRIEFVADLWRDQANQFAFGIEQILKDPFELGIGSLEELKKRQKIRIPGLGRTKSRSRTRKAVPQLA